MSAYPPRTPPPSTIEKMTLNIPVKKVHESRFVSLMFNCKNIDFSVFTSQLWDKNR